MNRLTRKTLNFLILISLFTILSPFVLAQTGCCEVTVQGEYCRTVDIEQCLPDVSFAPTSCEQTSYCKPGCCYSSSSGRCFMQSPRAACEKETDATWTDDPTCNFPLCKKGCCLISDQAFFVTEIQCRKTASDYEGVEFQFREDIRSESGCIAEARNKDQGCCIREDGTCTFTTRDNCDEASLTPEQIQIGARKTPGFYKDYLCSHEQLGCDCVKQSTTGCLGENLYWFDSCGNRENIYDRDTARSYNRGFVLSEADSCRITGPNDINCGNCDYSQGTVCGTDRDKLMPVGNNICIDLNCKTTYDDTVSPNADGGAKKHGESWCLYDSVPGLGRDMVGSRHYRVLCINGEEIIEPCKDFRDEICIQGVLGGEIFNNIEALTGAFRDEDYIEAGCRDNRWQDCSACNMINKVGENEIEKGNVPDAIIEARKKCCEDFNARDCMWIEGLLPGSPDVGGTCVPDIPPGLRFWGETPKTQPGVDTTTIATAAGATSTASSTSEAAQQCNKASGSCEVVFRREGLDRIGGGAMVTIGRFFMVFGEDGWTPIVNRDCTTHDWVVTGNTLCRSMGDCGAWYNVHGVLTKDGYINTQVDERNYFRGKPLADSEVGNPAMLLTGQGLDPGDRPGFWSDKNQVAGLLVPIAINVLGSGIYGGVAQGSWKAGFTAGLTPFGGIASAMGLIGKKGTSTIFSSTTATVGGVSFDVGTKLTADTFAQKFAQERITGLASDRVRELGMEQLARQKSQPIIQTRLQEEIISAAGRTATEETRQQVYQEILRSPDALRTGRISEIKTEITSQVIENQRAVVEREITAGIISDDAIRTAAQEQLTEEGKKTFERDIKNQLGKDGAVTGEAGVGGSLMTVVNTYLWVNTALNLINTFATQHKTVTYSIDCNPWMPPMGSARCEECNDPMKPCSEYKCRSLGANCILINQGTSDEMCVNSHPNDVTSPIITPNREVLEPDFTIEEVTEPAHPGFRIIEKVKPFQPLKLGINLDEPAICRYDVQPGKPYESMTHTFGANIFMYNQTVTFSLPSELAQENVTKETGGKYSMYVRCTDAHGNSNDRDFQITFTVDSTPDLTPPVIKYTNIERETFLSANTTEIDLDIYLDEPADCRWSRSNIAYSEMAFDFECAQDAFGQNSIYFNTFGCSTRLANLTSTINRIYIRCLDKPNAPEELRIPNEESFELVLKSSNPLKIVSAEPKGTVFDKEIILNIVTAEGAENGIAKCGYTTIENAPFETASLFAETDSRTHKQVFDNIPEGDYKYYIVCQDIGGNVAHEEINFRVEVDVYPPKIEAIYIDSIFAILHIEFDEPAECEYMPIETFQMGEGTKFESSQGGLVHETHLNLQRYYMKCVDQVGNLGSYVINIPPKFLF